MTFVLVALCDAFDSACRSPLETLLGLHITFHRDNVAFTDHHVSIIIVVVPGELFDVACSSP